MERTAEKNAAGNAEIVTRTTPVFKAVSEVLSILIFLSGCAVLLGWALDIPVLKSVFPGLVTMKANTALAFVFTGVSLWLLQIRRRDDPFCQRLAQISSGAVLTIGLLTFGEYIFGLDLGIDQFLFKELPGAILTSSPGRMAFNTAFNFTFMGSALLLLASRTKDRCLAAQILIVPPGGISLLALVVYLYRADPLFLDLRFSTAMALHTALLFLLVFFGTFFCRPGCGLMTLVNADTLGGKMIRRLFPVMALFPIVLGLLDLWGENLRLLSFASRDALFATLGVSIAALYFYYLSFWLSRMEEERNGAHEASRLTDERYHDLVEGTDDLITIVDGQDRFIFVNHGAEKIYGVKPEDCIGRSAFDFTHPGDRESTKKALEGWVRNKKEQVGYQNRQVHKDGRVFDVLWNINLHFDDSGEITQINSFAREITDIKRTEVVLKDSEERLKILFECAPDGYYSFDTAGNFLDANHMAQVLSGYQKEELLGKSFLKFKLLPLTQIPKAVAILAKNALGQATGPDYFTLIRKDGAQIEIETRNFPVKIKGERTILGIARDIAERKKTEKELQGHLKELEIFYKASIGREERILELKKQVAELEEKLKRLKPRQEKTGSPKPHG